MLILVPVDGREKKKMKWNIREGERKGQLRGNLDIFDPANRSWRPNTEPAICAEINEATWVRVFQCNK